MLLTICINSYGLIRNQFLHNDYVLFIQLHFIKEDIFLNPRASVIGIKILLVPKIHFLQNQKEAILFIYFLSKEITRQ